MRNCITREAAIKRLFLWIVCIVAFSFTAAAQDCPHPNGCVVISREAALKAVADADKVTALEAEGKAKDAAIAGLKDELHKMTIEFAAKSGENTALKQNAVSDRAIITELLKYTKKRCLPFSVCLF